MFNIWTGLQYSSPILREGYPRRVGGLLFCPLDAEGVTSLPFCILVDYDS